MTEATQLLTVPDNAPPLPTEHRKKIDDQWVGFLITHSWAYYNQDGTLRGYVVRYETNQGKETPQYTLWEYSGGRLKWHARGFSSPRPLYNLPRIMGNHDAKIIIVEGEKCAEALDSLIVSANLGSKLVAATWSGGTKSVDKTDWEPLKKRQCVVWPDKDKPGVAAASWIAAQLNRVVMVQPPDDKPEKWDVADAILLDGWTLPQITQFIKQSAKPVQQSNDEPPIESYDNQPPPNMEEAPPVHPDQFLADMPYQCLGYDHGNVYILPKETKQIVEIKASQIGRGELLTLAPLQHWEREYPSKTGPNWVLAANTVLRTCNRLGVYSQRRQRGIGAWWDDGRCIIHLGDCLLVDGRKEQLFDVKSKYVYQAAQSLGHNDERPLTKREAYQVQEICTMLPWKHPINAKLMAGWLVMAPIAGAIRWRPHIHLTGDSGSGKTTVVSEIIRPLLGDMSHNIQGRVTEAGVRQSVGFDSVPVVIDESEQLDERARIEGQKILELARQAFSDSDAQTVKGSKSGRAVYFNLKTTFLFAAIGVNITDKADQSRISVLELVESKKRYGEELAQKNYRDLQDKISSVLTSEFCSRFRARSFAMLKTIRANTEIFREAVQKVLGSMRMGDNIGTLLAAAYALGSDSEITPEAAVEWVASQDWEEAKDVINKDEPIDCLAHILQHLVRDGIREVSIYELIVKAMIEQPGVIRIGSDFDAPELADPASADAILKRHGIRVDIRERMVYVSQSHRVLRQILERTAWAKTYGKIIERIDGTMKKRMRFSGPTCAAVGIPISKIMEE